MSKTIVLKCANKNLRKVLQVSEIELYENKIFIVGNSNHSARIDFPEEEMAAEIYSNLENWFAKENTPPVHILNVIDPCILYFFH